jgi:hypothetical protein
MKLLIVLFFVIVIILAFDFVLIARHKHLVEKSSNCAVIHKPAKAECPKGYTQEQTPRFTERNGSKEFACVSADPAKEQCTDMLKAGESVTFRLFEFDPEPLREPPAPKPAGERKL